MIVSVRQTLLGLALSLALPAAAQNAKAAPVTPRPVRASDLLKIKTVSDPQVSPDGSWVAYTVTSIDSAKDKSDADVWMTNWEGTHSIQLTNSPERETTPRWSPDGRYLAFLSGRQDGKGAQVWLLDRQGGEAQRLTMIKDGVSAMEWSPDGRQLALIADINPDTAKSDTTKKKPIEITRYAFKRDVEGYLTPARSHILLIDVTSKKLDTLTSGLDDDDEPRWSPDGKRIAFIRSPAPEPGSGEGSDVFVLNVASRALVQLTNLPGPDRGPPAWSPDGAWIAFLRTDEPKWYAYQLEKLAVVKSDGSAPPRVLTTALDRPLSEPVFTADGASVLALMSDDRTESLVRVNIADGKTTVIAGGRRVMSGFSAPRSAQSRVAVLVSTPDRPNEVFALEGMNVRPLSRQNDSLFATLQLAPVGDQTSKSSDGTEVHSILMRPLNAAAGARTPMILYIHGGPNGQDNYGFNFARQWFAANGYAVLSVNYRGSSGRGAAYQKAIFADWGHKEVLDLMGAVDEAVRSGIADSTKLAIGGWSYGGILTDYSIATTTRFKAAVSGAGSANQLSMFGVDEYVVQYELELGAPWKAQDAWMKVSYPFFHADKIKTPTLVPRRPARRERAVGRRRTDVRGAANNGRADGARRVSGTVPRSHRAEFPRRLSRAVRGVVRQVHQAGGAGEAELRRR